MLYYGSFITHPTSGGYTGVLVNASRLILRNKIIKNLYAKTRVIVGRSLAQGVHQVTEQW